ncbi:GNAT family N-acetyltransferase [Microbacter margulisiae]|uniref:Ribosomal protein S18 acetylase RimI-like enzyme n=1 Tax=Microbacter margulisiae TaxID=1350067 RepID=A0A7W5H0U4_9PORP|nr:GNAT family N-acetyltransferase [Microbacter margulisiae]MBB3185929.1 ribosomal protein S18 acetylase RimI-like enzyme [Microbacter margulisiae]
MTENKAIRYEKGKLEELPVIFDLFTQAIREMLSSKIYQWDEIYPAMDVLTTDLQNGELYVGKIEGAIAVVFVVNQEYDEEYNNGKWNDTGGGFRIVHRLCVHPAYQHQGLARRTMEYIEQTLHKQEITSIRLDAFSENPFALRLYNSLDYKKVGLAKWRKGVFYLMEKMIR